MPAVVQSVRRQPCVRAYHRTALTQLAQAGLFNVRNRNSVWCVSNGGGQEQWCCCRGNTNHGPQEFVPRGMQRGVLDPLAALRMPRPILRLRSYGRDSQVVKLKSNGRPRPVFNVQPGSRTVADLYITHHNQAVRQISLLVPVRRAAACRDVWTVWQTAAQFGVMYNNSTA